MKTSQQAAGSTVPPVDTRGATGRGAAPPDGPHREVAALSRGADGPLLQHARGRVTAGIVTAVRGAAVALFARLHEPVTAHRRVVQTETYSTCYHTPASRTN